MADYELGKRIYTKIDELTFKIEENRHLESDISLNTQRQLMANSLTEMKKCIANVKDLHDKFKKYWAWYNEWCDIMNEAKKEAGLEYKDFEKVDLDKFENLLETNVEDLPKIELWNE